MDFFVTTVATFTTVITVTNVNTGRFKLPFNTHKVTFSQRSCTDGPTVGPTYLPTTRLLELLGAGKKANL